MAKCLSVAALIAATAALPVVWAEPVAPAPAAAMLQTVNLDSIKAIFDNAKVPATILDAGHLRLVQAELSGGYWILAAPIDCPNNDQTGACKSVALLSAVWRMKPGLEKVAAFVREHQRFGMPFTTEDGQPLLRYVISVADGVGPRYLENRMVDFYYEQKEFEQAMLGQGPASPGFSVAPHAKAVKAPDAAAALALLPAPHPEGKLAP